MKRFATLRAASLTVISLLVAAAACAFIASFFEAFTVSLEAGPVACEAWWWDGRTVICVFHVPPRDRAGVLAWRPIVVERAEAWPETRPWHFGIRYIRKEDWDSLCINAVALPPWLVIAGLTIGAAGVAIGVARMRSKRVGGAFPVVGVAGPGT